MRSVVVVLALLLAACSSGSHHAASGLTTTTTPAARAAALTAEQLNAHLGVGAPTGWLPVDEGEARLWVPPDWELEPQGAGICDSSVGRISIDRITNPHCNAGYPFPTPSQAVALFPMARPPSGTPLLTVHGYRIYNGPPLRWAFHWYSYDIPQLGVSMAAWGTLTNRILHTLAPSARHIALHSTSHTVANDSHSLIENGVSMSIPPSWGVPTPTAWGCGGWPSDPAVYLVNPDALVGDCGIYTQPLNAATHDGIALFLPSRNGRYATLERPIATLHHETTTIRIYPEYHDPNLIDLYVRKAGSKITHLLTLGLGRDGRIAGGVLASIRAVT